MRIPTVYLVHPTVAPYRHALFEAIARKLDLFVIYCSSRHRFRTWEAWPRRFNYRHVVLPGGTLGKSSINPGIIHRLVSKRPDAIILSGYVDATTWIVLVLATVLRVPVVYWTEGVREPSSLLGKMTRPIRLLFLKQAKAVVVPGSMSRIYVTALGAESEKVFVAPNSIDNSYFARKSGEVRPLRDHARMRLGLRDKTVILYVGQLVERKGVRYLIEAFSMLCHEFDNIALVLVGSGPQEKHLRQMAADSGGKNILFIPDGITEDDLIGLYSIADIFAFPSLFDVWGFVVNEAMACGLPVVGTTGSQAVSDVVRTGSNGFVTSPRNVHTLYSAMKTLVQDPEKREQMSREAVESITNNFGVEKMASGFMEAIAYALKSGQLMVT